MATTFQIGKEYSTRSICDYNCIWKFKVVKRTEKTVTLRQIGRKETKTFRPYIYNGVEQVRPLGSYSMCPILSADNHC